MFLLLTMKATALFVVILLHFYGTEAGFYTECDLDGVDRYSWLGYFERRVKINDDHEGVIATFKSERIIALKNQTSKYISATFENGVLTVSTNERFKRFEEEYKEHRSSVIDILLDFDCENDESETLHMRQIIQDINNHDPVLNQEVYEYNFGVMIPENYELTKFQPINAVDIDFTNREMYFSLDANEYLKVDYDGEQDYNDKTKFVTTLKALKPIRAPFLQGFTLVAMDGGDPARNSTSLVMINVTESAKGGEGEENSPHPPVFSKHLYFADYTSDDEFKMEEPIKIKYGVEANTVVKQFGYEEYFKIELDTTTGLLKVTKIKPLPKSILETSVLIAIEIEAVNEDFNIPGRTALIIRLHNIKSDDNSGNSSEDGSDNPEDDSNKPEDNSKNSNTIYVNYVHDNTTTALIISLSVTFIIVVLNVVVFACYFKKSMRSISVPLNQASVVELKQPEKLPEYDA